MTIFSHPDPGFGQPSGRVWPVFLPFAGCPARCVYCAQQLQTGQTAVSCPSGAEHEARQDAELRAVYETLQRDLAQARTESIRPLELAFFGGTFTALPAPWPERFLALVAEYKQTGLLTRIRCSTRPDAVQSEGGGDGCARYATISLERARDLGLDMVELGVQSFCSAVLDQSRRGYTGETARTACHLVQRAGLTLGIQLLPGLPGMTPATHLEDVVQTCALQPEIARLYPCLVLEGTVLASWFTRGTYIPWTLEQVVSVLPESVLRLWQASIRVVRIGVAPEPEMLDQIVAGPWHHSLGTMIRARAIFAHVREQMAQLSCSLLTAPARAQGELMGHASELRPWYKELGLEVRYAGDRFVLSCQEHV